MRLRRSWAASRLAGVLGLALTAGGQVLLSPQDTEKAGRVMDSAPPKDTLDCEVTPIRPFLDFAFRFEIGYVVRCPLKVFRGEAARLSALLRVRREGVPAALFFGAYEIPAMPPGLKDRLDPRRMSSQVEFSGAIVAGEGEYPLELVVMDSNQRFFRHTWTAKAALARNERHLQPVLKPGALAGMRHPFWEADEKSATSPYRITVLLDAAPINPLSMKLRAWDRAFLLNSLYSLLRHIPAARVRVVAFNLDQQREVFRQEGLDRFTFLKLAQALSNLELGTISTGTLLRQQGWAELLAGLIQAEVAGKPDTSAIIFLGPHARLNKKMACEAPAYQPGKSPPIYYFEYFARQGAEFPDSIEHLTNACKGRVFKLHSPGELGRNIAKMRTDLGILPRVALVAPQ